MPPFVTLSWGRHLSTGLRLCRWDPSSTNNLPGPSFPKASLGDFNSKRGVGEGTGGRGVGGRVNLNHLH